MNKKSLMCLFIVFCMAVPGTAFAAENDRHRGGAAIQENEISVPVNEVSEGSVEKKTESDLSEKLSELARNTEEIDCENADTGEEKDIETIMADHPEPAPKEIPARGIGFSCGTNNGDGRGLLLTGGSAFSFGCNISVSDDHPEPPPSVNDTEPGDETVDGRHYDRYGSVTSKVKDLSEESLERNVEEPVNEIETDTDNLFRIKCPSCGAELDLWEEFGQLVEKTESTDEMRRIPGIDPHRLDSVSHNLEEEADPVLNTTYYGDETCKITSFAELYEGTECIAAHIELSDYARLDTADAENGDFEDLSEAAERLNSLLIVGGDFDMPSGAHITVRNSQIVRDGEFMPCAVYSDKNGLLVPGDSEGMDGPITDLVKDRKVSDTLTYFPAFLKDGEVLSSSSVDRQRRVIMGTNGKAGDFWIVLCDGGADGKGLSFLDCANYLKSKGCVFGFQLTSGMDINILLNGEYLDPKGRMEVKGRHFLYIR